MMENGTTSDHEFVVRLRVAIERYLCAVDQWEAAHQNCYCLAGYNIVGNDDPERFEFHERRRELESILPRARRLCLKYGMRDPFSQLIRIELRHHSNGGRGVSAIGLTLRATLSNCLMELHAACRRGEKGVPLERIRSSLMHRLASYLARAS